ncbi:LysR family transcriptional regulator [Phenylobacterium sp.]|uniref:LysR family transcriptional regulator n=1 Tax=Phenylobacterium sp. TaxID=1871053 RepID=UPI002F42EA81
MTSWHGIDEFLAVVEAGSFTRAAEALGVSKSFVSKVVSDLEARLGAQLMVRTTRRLSLTAAGELFFERCRALRGELGDVERSMAQFQSRPVGRLRIALSDTFGSDFMSALLADFSAVHRDIAIEAIVYLRETDLAPERFDVVIRYGALENSSAHARLFGYMSYCLCASPDYVARHGWPASPRDLARHNCLSNISGQYHFNGGVRVRVSGNWVSNSGIALRWATRQGLGLAHLPVAVVRNDLLDGRIVAMQDEWTFYDQEVSAVFPSGITPTATRAFIDYLTTHFKLGKTRPSAASLRALADHLYGAAPGGGMAAD